MGQQQQQQHEPLTIEQGFNIAYALAAIAFWMGASRSCGKTSASGRRGCRR